MPRDEDYALDRRTPTPPIAVYDRLARQHRQRQRDLQARRLDPRPRPPPPGGTRTATAAASPPVRHIRAAVLSSTPAPPATERCGWSNNVEGVEGDAPVASDLEYSGHDVTVPTGFDASLTSSPPSSTRRHIGESHLVGPFAAAASRGGPSTTPTTATTATTTAAPSRRQLEAQRWKDLEASLTAAEVQRRRAHPDRPPFQYMGLKQRYFGFVEANPQFDDALQRDEWLNSERLRRLETWKQEAWARLRHDTLRAEQLLRRHRNVTLEDAVASRTARRRVDYHSSTPGTTASSSSAPPLTDPRQQRPPTCRSLVTTSTAAIAHELKWDVKGGGMLSERGGQYAAEADAVVNRQRVKIRTSATRGERLSAAAAYERYCSQDSRPDDEDDSEDDGGLPAATSARPVVRRETVDLLATFGALEHFERRRRAVTAARGGATSDDDDDDD